MALSQTGRYFFAAASESVPKACWISPSGIFDATVASSLAAGAATVAGLAGAVGGAGGAGGALLQAASSSTVPPARSIERE